VSALTVRQFRHEIPLHACFHIGLSKEDMQEVILQTIPYAGFPTAINAWNLLQQVANEQEELNKS
jgi:4-carboxymuconolactone decarboxylase